MNQFRLSEFAALFAAALDIYQNIYIRRQQQIQRTKQLRTKTLKFVDDGENIVYIRKQKRERNENI